MVVKLSPKALFNLNKDAVKAHRTLVDNPNFQITLSMVMAQFAQENPSAESLRGVNAFMDVLLNFAEEQKDQPGQFPHKRLTEPEEMTALQHEQQQEEKPKT